MRDKDLLGAMNRGNGARGCKDWLSIDVLEEYLRGHTPPELGKWIEEHLVICSECRLVFEAVKEEFELIRETLRSYDKLPPDFT